MNQSLSIQLPFSPIAILPWSYINPINFFSTQYIFLVMNQSLSIQLPFSLPAILPRSWINLNQSNNLFIYMLNYPGHESNPFYPITLLSICYFTLVMNESLSIQLFFSPIAILPWSIHFYLFSLNLIYYPSHESIPFNPINPSFHLLYYLSHEFIFFNPIVLFSTCYITLDIN